MSTDDTTIDQLGSLDDQPTGIGQGDYEPPSDNVRPPDTGTYTFMRVCDNEDVDFKHGRFTVENGDMKGRSAAWFNFKVAIQGGKFDQRTAFAGCNTLVSSFRPASSADDFLRACRSPQRPTTFKAYEEAVSRTFGPFNAKTNWEWRCRDCEDTFLKGYKNPKPPKKYVGPKPVVKKAADGSTSHVQSCPTCNAEVGAQLVITDYVVPRSNGAVAGPSPAAPTTTLPPAAG